MGCGTAYWLTKEGHTVLVLEQESIACGASGVAAAMLDAVAHGDRPPQDDPLVELVQASFALHQELARTLPEESGVDIGYRENPLIHPAFTREEGEELRQRALVLRQRHPDVRWLEGQDLWDLEPRLNREALGGMVSPQAQVLAYRFVLALATAAERRGMEMRHAEVVGLEGHADRVTGVRLRNGETIPAETVVLAMGPWSQNVTSWVGLTVPVYPVRGQLLELRVPDPQLRASISYGGMYLVRKADGITLAGATEEHDSGFVNHPTAAGRQLILDAALHMAPSLEEAQVQDQMCGLRPGSADGLPLIGPVPGWQGVYMVSGHFRSGMLLSAISTRIIADLITKGRSPLPIEAFNPGRFGRPTS
jgi:glycine oxidase